MGKMYLVAIAGNTIGLCAASKERICSAFSDREDLQLTEIPEEFAHMCPIVLDDSTDDFLSAIEGLRDLPNPFCEKIEVNMDVFKIAVDEAISRHFYETWQPNLHMLGKGQLPVGRAVYDGFSGHKTAYIRQFSKPIRR